MNMCFDNISSWKCVLYYHNLCSVNVKDFQLVSQVNVFDQRYGGGYGSSRVLSNHPASQLEPRDVPSPYVQTRSHSQLTLGVSAQHGGDLDVYYNRSRLPENGYGRPPEQSWFTKIFLWFLIFIYLSGICCCHVNVEESSLRLRNVLLCTVQ